VFEACEAACAHDASCCEDEECEIEDCEEQCFFWAVDDATETCKRLAAVALDCWAASECGEAVELACESQLTEYVDEGCRPEPSGPEEEGAVVVAAMLPAAPPGSVFPVTSSLPPPSIEPPDDSVEPEPSSPVDAGVPDVPRPGVVVVEDAGDDDSTATDEENPDDPPEPIAPGVEPTPTPSPSDDPPVRSATGPSFAETLAPLLDAKCTESCHEPGGLLGGPGGFFEDVQQDLTLNASYQTLTTGRSKQLPTMWLVGTGLDDSYLWHKLNDTFESVGGEGAKMPVTGEFTGEDLEAVRAWIEGGASP
jgi:hypothetical protein